MIFWAQTSFEFSSYNQETPKLQSERNSNVHPCKIPLHIEPYHTHGVPPFYIECDGMEPSITKNLDDALRKLRREDRAVKVWADAIFINQKNNQEKSQQVARMREIYAKAESLFIWIGNPAKPGDEDTAFDTLNKLESIFVHHADADMLRLPINEPRLGQIINNSNPELIEDLKINDIEKPQWKRLGRLYLIPCFSRVWIVQEAISVTGSARINMTLAYGTRKASWDTFATGTGGMSLFRGMFDLIVHAIQALRHKLPSCLIRMIQIERNTHRATIIATEDNLSDNNLRSMLDPSHKNKIKTIVNVKCDLSDIVDSDGNLSSRDRTLAFSRADELGRRARRVLDAVGKQSIYGHVSFSYHGMTLPAHARCGSTVASIYLVN
jgi:hypothetical protein